MDVRPLASDAQEFNIADPVLRRGVLVLRWLLVGAYVLLVRLGVLDVSGQALLISASMIASWSLLHTVAELTGRGLDPRLVFITRYVDVMMETTALIALHDVRNPVWAVYFITIVGVAHVVTRREMAVLVVWAIANYMGFALITQALGHSVAWSYAIVVAVLIGFMGFNAAILAGGEQRLRDVIARVAVTDSLTGLPNRRHFHQAYVTSLAHAIAGQVPLALMLIDVDHFKEINDRDGHPAGDDKLRDVARGLQQAVRRGDLVARYGGDEFIVVAPHATREDALVLAERLRQSAVDCAASVSIGLAIFPQDAELQDGLVAAADAALYRAKQAGRNCVRDAA
jgi:diguanylate cyclase (GGDEF)-like protein